MNIRSTIRSNHETKNTPFLPPKIWNYHPFTTDSIQPYFSYLGSRISCNRDFPFHVASPSRLPLTNFLVSESDNGNPESVFYRPPDFEIAEVAESNETRLEHITASLSQGGFPVVLAEALTGFCDLSYSNLSTTQVSSVNKRFVSHFQVFDFDHSQGIGFMFEGHPFLVFRGSEEIEDWMRNLDTKHSKLGNSSVHSGFLLNLKLIWKQVIQWARSLPSHYRGYILGGHSLGGAMATIAAYKLASNKCPVDAVISFGAPRAGDVAFCQDYDALGLGDKTWRVIYGEDRVPDLPPRSSSYQHVGMKIHLASPRQLTAFQIGRTETDYEAHWQLLTQAAGCFVSHADTVLNALPKINERIHQARSHMRAYGYSVKISEQVSEKLRELCLQHPQHTKNNIHTGLLMHKAYITA